ncbi:MULTISPECIES: hypothetical protein [Calidithermus]|nr:MULTISPECIES: hypothetical protein [Calidithermus]
MEDQSLNRSEMVVNDRKAAELLTRPEALVYLAPFMKGPRSLRQVAGELSTPIPNLHYWADKFLRLGLLEVVKVERRVGRPIRYYQARAQRYIVPQELVPMAHFEHTERVWNHRLWVALEQASPELLHQRGVEIRLELDGTLTINPSQDRKGSWDILGDGVPAVLNTWSDALLLDPPDAKALQRELLELFERYRRKSGNQRYIIHIGLAPRESDRLSR